MEVPDRGLVVVRTRSFGAPKALVHLVTGEQAEIPDSAGAEVLLHFGDDGFGFLAVAGAHTWCSDLFELRLVEDAGAYFVLQPNGAEAVSLGTWLSQVKRLSVEAPGSDNDAGIGVWLFARPWWGAQAWRSLFSSWERARPEGRMTCSQWQQSWWPWWRTTLSEINLPVPHLRRACPYHGRRGRNAAAENYFGVDPRVLEESTLSSHACVAILSRLACPRKVSQTAAKTNTMSWAQLLDHICCNMVAPHLLATFALCLDSRTACAPFLASSGRSMVQLTCDGGLVDLRPPEGAGSAGYTLSGMLDRVECISIADLLIQLYRLGKPAREVFKQLVCVCGCALDDFVVAVASGPSPMHVDAGAGASAGSGAGGGDGPTPGRASLMVRMAAAFQAGGRRMLRYFFCARKVFKAPQYLGLSVDASRVARKNVLLGAITTPENVGAWCPPQVASGFGPCEGHDCTGECFFFGERFAKIVYVIRFLVFCGVCLIT